MMMKEISLHILDIAQNSIVASASHITITIDVNRQKDYMSVTIDDDGTGMSEKTLANVTDPFSTSRTTRKVGLGVPMFKAGAEASGGGFSIKSQLGVGTCVEAGYKISHIDRPPLGDMAQTMLTLVVCNPDIDFAYRYIVDGNEFFFSTKAIKEVLGDGVDLNLPDVMGWMREYLNEGIKELNGGV